MDRNWRLLHRACWAGDAAEVERLLAAGANPNQVAPTNWRQTPLGRTLEFRVTHPKHAGHVDVVRALLAAGADPAARSTHLDFTPYELASFCGLEAAADLLREAQSRASPHPTGMPEIWIAAASRLPEAVTRPDGDVNCMWRESTPLMMAAGHAAHFGAADLLLELGADADVGTSILHASCEWHFEHLIPALKYLASNGWNVNGRSRDGQTALHKAAFLGYAMAARTLLRLGADPAMQDAGGKTPLDLARRFRKPAAIKALGG